MYRYFRATNYRGLKDIELDDLAKINLVTGLNNVGKTSLLEALFIHAGAYNPQLTLSVNALRGMQSFKVSVGDWVESIISPLFSNYDLKNPIKLVGEYDLLGRRSMSLKVVQRGNGKGTKLSEGTPAGTRRIAISTDVGQVVELRLEEAKGRRKTYSMYINAEGVQTDPFPPEPPFPTWFLSARLIEPNEIAERFGKLELAGIHEVVLKALQLIEPNLRRLAVVVTNGTPVIHGEIGLAQLIPLPMMGGGMARLANLITHIGNARNGVVLIDEIENGLHHSVLPDLWRTIGNAANEFNTQIFATTHSLECIDAAHQSFRDSGREIFRLHRLENVNGTVQVKTYREESLDAALEVGLEVR